jgi:Uma2 family endonuclease
MQMPSSIRKITVDEFAKMAETGIIDPREQIELLDGRLVHRIPDVGPDHTSVVARCTRAFVLKLDGAAMVFPQCTLRLSLVSAPMPDFSIVPPRDDFYRSGAPSIAELYAIVEVSQSSLQFDRTGKARLYARAGVREYWIANLIDWTIERHRNPHDLGYATLETYVRTDEIAFAAVPSVTFDVNELLGTPAEVAAT